MKPSNEVKLTFLSRSANEGFARTVAACFAAQLDPTLDEVNDINTANKLYCTRLPGQTGHRDSAAAAF